MGFLLVTWGWSGRCVRSARPFLLLRGVHCLAAGRQVALGDLDRAVPVAPARRSPHARRRSWGRHHENIEGLMGSVQDAKVPPMLAWTVVHGTIPVHPPLIVTLRCGAFRRRRRLVGAASHRDPAIGKGEKET